MSIVGNVYGYLTVIERTSERTKTKRALYLCKCKCGNEIKVPTYYLNSGDTKSCGCYKKELTIKRSTKHGLRHSKEHTKIYRTWLGMRARCNNSNDTFYKNYGGKGIKVDKRWDDFTLFLSDMGFPPNDGKKYSIDRIDPYGNYTPTNCKWSTDIEQANNRTNNRYIEQNGVSYTVAQFCRHNNISDSLVRSRLLEGKTKIEDLLKPKKIKNNTINASKINKHNTTNI